MPTELYIDPQTIQILLLLTKLVLGMIFLVSGIQKLRAPNQAALAMSSVGMPTHLSQAGAYLIAVWEVLLSTLLLLSTSPQVLQIAGVLSVVTLGVFCAFLIYVIRKGVNIGCGCFGDTQNKTTFFDVIRNLVLMTLGLYVAVSAPSSGHLSLSVMAYLAVILNAVTLSVIFANFSDLFRTLLKPFTEL